MLGERNREAPASVYDGVKASFLVPAIVLPLLLGACAAEPEAPGLHDLTSLERREGPHVALRTDLPPALAGATLDRLEKLEALLDKRFPFLQTPPDRVLAIVVEDEGHFRLLAHAHGVPPGGATAFSCARGEVAIRYRPDEWGEAPPGSWSQGPRGGSVAEAVFRRRLEATYGPSLERTWLEDGCARAFAEEAARETGEAREAARRSRDDLLDAFLPLFLGAEPRLAKTVLARGRAAVPHGSEKGQRPAHDRAVAYAVARFLLESQNGDRAAIVRAAFEAAAGKPGAADELAAREPDLRALEPAFEGWLRSAVTDALLDALENEPVLAARWETRAALRLVAAVDVELDDAATKEQRTAIVARARAEVASRKTVRFADEFDQALLDVREHHRSGALERLVAHARSELDERARGYGHPAIEELRGQLGKVLEARLKSL
jgi:hypothetical protein